MSTDAALKQANMLITSEPNTQKSQTSQSSLYDVDLSPSSASPIIAYRETEAEGKLEKALEG